MLPLSLSKSSVIQGEALTLRFTTPAADEYDQVQVEVLTAGVRNPHSALGFGMAPQQRDADIEVEVDTRHLKVGVYEVGLVRLHSPKASGAAPQLDFIGGRDFHRQLFEVRAPADPPRTSEELLTHVTRFEEELYRQFTSPVDLRQDKSQAADEFSVLVFVKDLLVGVGMRFDHFEIVPTRSGLDTEDAVQFVNAFLRDHATGIAFDYDAATRENARRSNPVCVIHFPAILANSVEAARDYCVEEGNTLLLALSLTRDAGGVVFEIVLVTRATGQAVKYGVTNPYVGNLLLGGLSGEHFESVQSYLTGITRSGTNRFLVSLYREARRERSRDFQYVRYWQILETMADGRNYDPGAVLRDYEGNPMMESGRQRLIKGAVNTVFNMFREEQIGETAMMWKNVNIWFAFRNAVAHHGAISRYASLSVKSVREWARIGYEELQRTPDHDVFLWTLKEDVRGLLMRQLVRSAMESAPEAR